MASFTQRMIGAAMLRVRTYEEVEADVTATGQALGVVVLSSLAAGIGTSNLGVSRLFWVTLSWLAAWLLWAGLAFVIGTKLLPEPATRSDLGELLRTIGFAASPGVLRILGIVPWIGWLLVIMVYFWMLAATVLAVRQALDYESTKRAVAVCLVGFVIHLAVGLFVGGVLVL